MATKKKATKSAAKPATKPAKGKIALTASGRAEVAAVRAEIAAAAKPAKAAKRSRATGNPRGRPPRAEAVATNQVRVKFTDSERDEIDRKCLKIGISMAEAVRLGLVKVGVLSA